MRHNDGVTNPESSAALTEPDRHYLPLEASAQLREWLMRDFKAPNLLPELNGASFIAIVNFSVALAIVLRA